MDIHTDVQLYMKNKFETQEVGSSQWRSGAVEGQNPQLSADKPFSGLIGWPWGSTRSGAVESRNSQLSAGGPFRDQ